MKHLINWVEIPALDIERAKRFYSKILGGISFTDYPMPDARYKYSLFPSEDSFNAGALVQSPDHTPSADGVVVYLDGEKDMDKILNEVKNAGGRLSCTKLLREQMQDISECSSIVRATKSVYNIPKNKNNEALFL